jgi:4-oxalocrotonate tautomerase
VRLLSAYLDGGGRGVVAPSVRVWLTEVPKTQWGIAGKTAKDLGR